MHLRELLQDYEPFDPHEAAMVNRLRTFLAHEGDLFGRELAGTEPDWGHVTGSAWIISEDGAQTVLVHHAKLGKWVQPGGHSESESDTLAVAAREAREETGLGVTPLQTTVFDVDVHLIPEYWNTPAHFHYDVRFLFEADANMKPIVSAESRAVRWVSLEEAMQLGGEASIARMVAKTRIRFGE